MEKSEIEVVGWNADAELFYCYMDEWEKGYTDLDYDEWLDEFYNELETFDYDMEVFNIEDNEE